MNVQNLKLMQQLYPTKPTVHIEPTNKLFTDALQETNTTSFSNVLNQSLSRLEEKQLASDSAIQGLVTGELDNLHDVMIQTTEAQIALELAVELRNRSLEAMNEIKNMQF